MMVLASVYLSVSASLPNTANIKPVEIWLLFNLTWPFLIIVTNIIIQVTENKWCFWFIFIFSMFEVLERELREDNNDDKRKVRRKISVEPLDKETILIRTQYAHKYAEQILVYCVKFFYPAIYGMFLIGYLFYFLILFQ